MSNIEKIRQEIERQLEYFKGKEDDTWDDCDNYTDEDAMWYQGHWKMCSRLLTFIESLPEEKPSEDLEEAAIDFADNARKQLYSKDYAISSIADYDHGCIDGFIAGAEWQYQKDRGEFAKIKAKTWSEGFDACKEQMMKDAVEGEIGYWNQRGLSIRLDKSLERLGYDMDTKVKIVIEKQDDRPRD